MYFPFGDKQTIWKDFTLILPCVSVGNVGQLSADLLVSTLNMTPAGRVYHASILPVVGSDPFADPNSNTARLTTSCEVYEDKVNKIVVLQQRAPFAKGRRGSFVQWFSEWTKQQGFKQVIILTTSFAEERLDTQLQGSQFRYVASESISKQHGDTLETSLGWKVLEKRPSPMGLDTEAKTLYMPGSGIAKQLYENLESSVPVVILMMFCSEGDNAHDAVAMTSQLNTLLTLKNAEMSNLSQWKIPSSWRLVFGTRADQTLFH